MGEILAGALLASVVSSTGVSASVSTSSRALLTSGSLATRGVSASGTAVSRVATASGTAALNTATNIWTGIGNAVSASGTGATRVSAGVGNAVTASGSGVSKAATGVGGKVAKITMQIGKMAINECQKLNQSLAELRAECPNIFGHHDQFNAKRGDIIEFMRDIYSHFGICIDDKSIVHFCLPENSSSYVYRRDKIGEVANGSKCRINNLEAGAQRRGLIASEIEEIIARALDKINLNGVYNLLENNCETFVTECRYGMGFSEQSYAVEDKPLLKVAANIVGGALTE